MTADSTAQTPSLAARLGDDLPLIAVSFTDQVEPSVVTRMIAEGLDVAELRIDQFVNPSVANAVAVAQRFSAIPTIATVRAAAEGGDWTGTEVERLDLYRAIAPHVDALDIELHSPEIVSDVIAAAHGSDALAIVSHHNFVATPEVRELDEFLAAAKAASADLVKIAANAATTDDLRVLASFAMANREEGVIVVAMGPFGPASRVFFPMLGSRLTYAHGGSNAVPGQLPFAETFAYLRTFSPAFNERHAVGPH